VITRSTPSSVAISTMQVSSAHLSASAYLSPSAWATASGFITVANWLLLVALAVTSVPM
jgi:hypothetical protein